MDGAITVYWWMAWSVLFFAALITWHTVEHRRFVRSRTSHPETKPPMGRVALFVPCKGADPELEANLRPLFEQSHPNYCLTFVVENSRDEACPIIESLLVEYPQREAELVVAGICVTGGQKVHNLLHATSRIPADVSILAFADTDICPSKDWLRLLTQHLHRYGASTGYRCYIPQRNTLANLLLASINSAATGMMIPGRHHLVWGGSWAIRRDVFESGRLREAWQGTLSDDMMATRVLSRLRERIAFEPACMVASKIDMRPRQAASFLRRQLAIGRCCAPAVWTAALILFATTQVVFWTSAAAAIWGAATGREEAWKPALVAAAIYAMGLLRGRLRKQASRYYLPDRQAELKTAQRFDQWASPLTGLATLAGLISSAVGRRIVWRGFVYEMRVGGQARRVGPPLTSYLRTSEAGVSPKKRAA